MTGTLPGAGDATADVDRVSALATRVDNSGRWGADDQAGTVNLISPEAVLEAAGLVRRGRVFGLGVPLGPDGPQRSNPVARRFDPLHFMTETHGLRHPGGLSIADDVVVLPLQCGTQWDALAHVAGDGVMYGGRPASMVTSQGAEVNDVAQVADRIVSRGILVDVARFRGLDSLAPGEGIDGADLAACLDHEGVSVRPGDILLIRTGFLAACRARDWAGYHGDAPGLSVWSLDWLHENDVAAVAADTPALEVKPSSAPPIKSPFHLVAIGRMGLLLGEIFDLEELALDCDGDGVYEFLLVAPGLKVIGGVGTPVNPYAIK